MGNGRTVQAEAEDLFQEETVDFMALLAIAVKRLGGEMVVDDEEFDAPMRLGFDLDFMREHDKIKVYTVVDEA